MLCLTGGIRQAGSQLVENSAKLFSFKFHINFLEGFAVSLKTFLGLVMPNLLPSCVVKEK